MSINNNEVVAYYDRIAKEYDNSRFDNTYGKFIDAEERRVLDTLIGNQNNLMILDMACGTGRLTNYATHGLDASKEMLTIAQKKHPDVEFLQASATTTRFNDDSFDIIISFHLLMHLDKSEIKNIFDEAYRILKPNGRLIVDIPSQKRRKLLHHKQSSWHGGTSLSTHEIKMLTQNKFSISRCFGIMLLPIHHFPNCIRKSMLRIDYLLANSFLKPYASYIVFELTKL